MPDFTSALALLVLGQIPLLVKLWLDQKNTISGHRLEIYKRQLAAAELLAPALLKVQANCDTGLVAIRSLTAQIPSEERTILTSGFRASLATFQDATDKTEVVLPASLIVSISKYHKTALQIHFLAMGGRVSNGVSIPSHDELQEQNLVQFAAVRNLLRVLLGTERLSETTIRQLHAGTGGIDLLVQGQRRPK